EEHLAYLEKSMKYEDTYETVSAMLDTAATIPASRQYLQGAAILLDSEDGAIRAMLGGRDFRHSEYNRAVQSSRQPGSSFKPFVYLAALENGLAPSDQILDAPLVVKQRGQEPWKPRNHSGKFKGEVTLRHALDKSINIPAVRLIQRLGPSTVIDYARRLGIDSPLPNVLSLALGAADVPLIEITGAYGTLARGGVLSEPYAILRVVDRWGHVLEEHQAERREVLDSKTCYLMTNMLQSVITQGTGVRARRMGLTRPAAGKTGTTDNNNDAWFVGYTPDYVCGVWVGFDERKDMGRWMEGAHAALPIWTGIMLAAHDSLEVREFEVPEGVGKLAVCRESSLLPTRYCPETMQEVFIEGREPNRPCDRHSLSSSQWRGSGSEFRDMDRQSMEVDEFNSP
ncbi:MAG: penicillin-binding transpeptidase domain-containing protein, partial [Candidatus Krumholzibacteria bacterium]|nr:penicillin-binding transpeptidase domain-containing protein [Candidatus Krumholzibacteria bacterium]